jgi:hypothetical protein
MKSINLKGKFWAAAMRSASTVILLILFLLLAPQVDILKNQHVVINNTIKTGVEVARVLISLIIVGVLLNFAYISESQLPQIIPYKPVGLIIASVIHIIVIFVAYYYLLPFAKDRLGNVNQIFNIIFLIMLCVPLYRGGVALNKLIGEIANKAVEPLHSSIDRSLKCEGCGVENDDPSAKFCKNCGKLLSLPQVSFLPVVCNNCNYKNEPSAKFCANCGFSLLDVPVKPQITKCLQCDAEIKLGTKYCPGCGTEQPTNL